MKTIAPSPNRPSRRPSGETHDEPAISKQTFLRRLRNSTVLIALLGAALLYAAFPPLGWSLLAWVAPIPLLVLVDMKALPGRRPYLALWAAGLLHWLALIQGIRLAHWAVHFGWIAMALYLAVYFPLFVGLTRVAVHRLGAPLILAAPVVWTGLEYLRGYFATGFSMALLGHTQVEWTPLLQIADVFGAYGVTFLVVLVAACLYEIAKNAHADRVTAWRPAMIAAAALALAWGYGVWRMAALTEDQADQNVAQIALLQQPIDMFFMSDPQENREIFMTYLQQASKASAERPDLDLIVWPESIFTLLSPLVSWDDGAQPPPQLEMKPYEFAARLDAARARFADTTRQVLDQFQGEPALLVGGSTSHYTASGDVRPCNSAIFIDRQGEVTGRYDKMHPVMFGEYVPFGDRLPWLYDLTPLPSGLSRGSGPAMFEIEGVRLTANICFESTVPHLIRKQVVQLEKQGKMPDAIVNVTNDGWFRGSSILDFQYACAVFRAVELRRPFLVAANAGFSAWIDATGRSRAKGPRRDSTVLFAQVVPVNYRSVYRSIGDWPAFVCLMFCALCAGWGVVYARWPSSV